MNIKINKNQIAFEKAIRTPGIDPSLDNIWHEVMQC